MTTHKTIKKLIANAKNEKPLMANGKRPVMELQINRMIKKEMAIPIERRFGIAGVNNNF